jgi:hypothetical protein
MANATMGPFAIATVMTPEPVKVAEGYRRYAGYKDVGAGTIASEWAGSWATPAMIGRRFAMVQAESGNGAILRFVEGTPPATYQPFRTYGWNALEILAKDVDKLPDKLKGSPFEIIGMPRNLYPSGSIRAMQTKGAAQEMVYFTQINEAKETDYLPKAKTFVDHLFIVILGSNDFDLSREFYSKYFAVEHGDVHVMRVTGLNVAFGLDIETKHRLSVIKLADKANIELDDFPKGAKHREINRGELPPGIGMLSFYVDSLDKVRTPFRALPVKLPGTPYNGKRAATVVGSAGEWLELIER